LTDKKKCFGEVPVHFESELNKVGFSNIHTDENLKDWGRGIVEAVLRKLFAHIYWHEYISCFGEGK
jgi:hypothetical protein